MNKTKIEYLDYVWNFMTGCENWRNGDCPVGRRCWAYQRAQRFNEGDFTPKLHTDKLMEPLKLKRPARIGVCFTGDLFGDWVNPNQQVEITTTHPIIPVAGYLSLQNHVKVMLLGQPDSQFLFLTKNPTGYLKWGKFPDNAWLGTTVCRQEEFTDALYALSQTESNHKWVSFEPLMQGLSAGLSNLRVAGISWVVIGGWSRYSPKTAPKVEWIREIVEAADKAKIPVFLKNNLKPLLSKHAYNTGMFWNGRAIDHPLFASDELRQEFPIR